ncbi:competence/damage-inducible protein A [Mongoliimonas terrestris]|uniref:competence/damage-inducible protein A n=1 Tax=Mongoliimonas terrestris TaxID=1709001 RepID=UPI0009496AE1|nr:molybdopterin-binding protein [Mongoliimonas terrestris]
MSEHSAPTPITAGIVVIGDEILSGRTRDTNSGTIAAYLTSVGIDLREVRVVPDDQDMIVEAVNTLRSRYTYVFTTGGIGPTHDDITADAVGAAFGVPVDHDPRAVEILRSHYARPEDLTDARLRMARIPAGADLIANPLTKAPGFRIGNVFVMAGVPKIMEVMLDGIGPQLATGAVIHSVTVDCPFGEGVIGTALGAVAAAHPLVTIGSYPMFDGRRFATKLVVRSRDPEALAEAEAAVRAMVDAVAAASAAAPADAGSGRDSY